MDLKSRSFVRGDDISRREVVMMQSNDVEVKPTAIVLMPEGGFMASGRKPDVAG